MMNSSFERIEGAKESVIQVLQDKKIEKKYLQFGGVGLSTAKPPSVPTDARSEFLANRAMGDWAEDTLASAITKQFPGHKAAHYGDNDRISAGDDGFKEFYLSRLERVRVSGKRPDLLVLPEAFDCPENMPSMEDEDLDNVIKAAIASIEVRSSKFEAETYQRVKKERKSSGKLSIRESLSFTVKVEDLIIVYRWMEKNRITQIYSQVFFDSVYAINFASIFEIIASGSGFAIETPAKSQQKSTIMIPITSGRRIGTFSEPPVFVVEHRVTKLGRHDAYVRPEGGSLKLSSENFKATINS